MYRKRRFCGLCYVYCMQHRTFRTFRTQYMAYCELTSARQECSELRLLPQRRRYFQHLLRKLVALYFPLLPLFKPNQYIHSECRYAGYACNDAMVYNVPFGATMLLLKMRHWKKGFSFSLLKLLSAKWTLSKITSLILPHFQMIQKQINFSAVYGISENEVRSQLNQIEMLRCITSLSRN